MTREIISLSTNRNVTLIIVVYGKRPRDSPTMMYYCFRLKESSSFGFTTTDPVRVYNTGTVRWLVPLNIETGCDVDIAQFPFDSQTCSIDFIYWITSKEETVVTKVASVEKVCIVAFIQAMQDFNFFDISNIVLIEPLGERFPPRRTI